MYAVARAERGKDDEDARTVYWVPGAADHGLAAGVALAPPLVVPRQATPAAALRAVELRDRVETALRSQKKLMCTHGTRHIHTTKAQSRRERD
jgi:hypothetical protein